MQPFFCVGMSKPQVLLSVGGTVVQSLTIFLAVAPLPSQVTRMSPSQLPLGSMPLHGDVWHLPASVQNSLLAQTPQFLPQPSSPQTLPVQTGMQSFLWHKKSSPQLKPASQIPHWPPQPSSPHFIALPAGVTQTLLQKSVHALPSLQNLPLGQKPQTEPQPSGPQILGMPVVVFLHCLTQPLVSMTVASVIA